MASHKQVALVTGASSGIGQATAELLAAHGFTVFGTSRTPIQDKRSYTWLPLDVRSDDSVQAAVQSLLAQAGRIDVLVNNAGYVQFGAIEESNVADAQAQFDTNLCRGPSVRSERLAGRAKLCEHTARHSAANQPDRRLHPWSPDCAAKPRKECPEGPGGWGCGPRHPARRHQPATSALPSWTGWKNSTSAPAIAARVSV
jgi:NAD(P)-dependent dehydrogenase (short-subunit alcohol dehydrogenase family)